MRFRPSCAARPRQSKLLQTPGICLLGHIGDNMAIGAGKVGSRRPGEECGLSKLTEAQAIAIKQDNRRQRLLLIMGLPSRTSAQSSADAGHLGVRNERRKTGPWAGRIGVTRDGRCCSCSTEACLTDLAAILEKGDDPDLYAIAAGATGPTAIVGIGAEGTGRHWARLTAKSRSWNAVKNYANSRSIGFCRRSIW